MSELQELKRKIDQLDQLIQSKQQELNKQDKSVTKAYQAVLKERNDVNELDEKTFSKTFSKLTGSYDQKKAKEESEAKEAEDDFLAKRKLQKNILKEIEAYKQEQIFLKGVNKQHLVLFKEKMEQMINDPMVQTYKQSILRYQKNIQDIHAILDLIHQALNITREIKKDLNEATTASVVDIVGVPLLGDVIKYAKIGEIKNKADQLNNILNKIQYSIKGIKLDEGMVAFGVADLMLDNIILDAIALGKILNLRKEIDSLENQLNQKVKQLKKDERDILTLIQRTTEKMQDYIINA